MLTLCSNVRLCCWNQMIVMSGPMIGVSVLIPSDDSEPRYLLQTSEGRGWWLIRGHVSANGATAKSTAQRIATLVRSFYNLLCFFKLW